MKNFRYHITLGLLRMMACLPLGVLYVLSDAVAFVGYRVVRYRLRVVRRNLRNALPGRDESELRRIEREFYRHLADCVVESVKLLHISDSELRRRVEIRNADLVNDTIAGGRPVVMFLGHYGNWEWVQAVTMAFRGDYIGGEIYRPLRNEAMDLVMHRIRSRFNTIRIPQNKAVRTLLRLHSEGKRFVVGFIADQYPNNHNQRHWTDFLHQRASYVTGGEEIGRRVGARFVYLEVAKSGRGHYVMTFKPLEVPPDSREEFPFTIEFLRRLEAHISRTPEYWLWSHNRWRHTEPAAQPSESATEQQER